MEIHLPLLKKRIVPPHLEPHLDPTPKAAPEPGLRRALLSRWQAHDKRRLATIAVLSLLLHALLLVLVILFAGRTEVQVPEIVPVKLVMAPPPAQEAQKPPEPPPEKPKQQAQKEPEKQQQKPAPSQRPLASDELGDPTATGKEPTPTHAPAAGTPTPKPGEAPPPPSDSPQTPKPSEVAPPDATPEPDKSQSIKQAEIPKTAEQLAEGGALAPPPPPPKPAEHQDEAAKPTAKPSNFHLRTDPGGARHPTPRPADPNHGEGRIAKYPGPDADRDEYLAYIRDLTDERLATIPPNYFRNRQGRASYDVIIRPNGTIVWFAMLQSSGYPDTDRALNQALNGIERFPPLPPELLEKDGNPTHLSFTLPLGALARDR